MGVSRLRDRRAYCSRASIDPQLFSLPHDMYLLDFFIQVQRLVGLKAAELGANAVVGYQQDFDLEGEAGVVARAIGKYSLTNHNV